MVNRGHQGRRADKHPDVQVSTETDKEHEGVYAIHGSKMVIESVPWPTGVTKVNMCMRTKTCRWSQTPTGDVRNSLANIINTTGTVETTEVMSIRRMT